MKKGASVGNGASNSQGPSKGMKDLQWQLLQESKTDTWTLQGLSNKLTA